MIFKVGDKVKIREDLVEGKYKGPLYVNDEMAQMAGKTLTIKVLRLTRECYTVEENEWDWNDEMLEKLPNLKPVDQVIGELVAERDAIKNKNKKAGQMIARGGLGQEQNYLLAAQKHAYETVYHILNIRIRSLKKQVPASEPEPKKYNVIAWKDPKGIHDTRYWFRLSNGEPSIAEKNGNEDSNQQWTLDQIKEYGLERFERVEVQDEV